MRTIPILLLSLLVASSVPLAAQRGAAGRGGNVTFAVLVSDPAGNPIPEVKVTLTGAAERTSRTEAGRIVFEGLPAGSYHFRFEKDGFVPFEKDLSARGSAPIDVKVTLSPAPPPPKPVAQVAPPPPSVPDTNAKPVVLDMPDFIEKNYVGRAAGKIMPLGCSSHGSATLIQINDPIASHAHADADEYIYVIAGQGSAKLGTRDESLGPGVYLMIPHGVAHAFSAAPKKPLVMISIRAGDVCAG